MKRTCKIVAVLAAIGIISGPVLAMPASPWLTSPGGQGSTYRRLADVPLGAEAGPVHMPGIATGGEENRSAYGFGQGRAQGGPQLTGDDLISPRGGALVNPTGGGPMYSPKQQGDRQIAQLIKTLG